MTAWQDQTTPHYDHGYDDNAVYTGGRGGDEYAAAVLRGLRDGQHRAVKTYKIVRFCFDEADPRNKSIIRTGLTLDEAQAHCQRDDTHGDGWFDGYDEET